MTKKSIKLHVWRQNGPKGAGHFEDHTATNVTEEMSFLEVLDELNEKLIADGKDPVAFDHDCREGICGMCSMVLNGHAHGPNERTTTCQVHMRHLFNEGWDEVWVEPWRASSFPVIRDLSVDRTSLDRIIQAGGYVSIRIGSARDANEAPIPKPIADRAMDAAACIGCGACVAACPNASASLFTAAKVAHLGLLPQGQGERAKRAKDMVVQADKEGFGGCTNHGECEKACPKGISLDFIAMMNREHLSAVLTEKPEVKVAGGD